MKAVIQRVKQASVSIEGRIKGQIGMGLLILVGVEDADRTEDVDWLARKICGLRIFADDHDLMNHSLVDIQGEILIVSQFTLHASTKKGSRPSFIKAARPEHAIPIYEAFCKCVSDIVQKPVKTGEFGAMMEVALINDGPVTIIIDTKSKE